MTGNLPLRCCASVIALAMASGATAQAGDAVKTVSADNQVEETIISKAVTARGLGCDYVAPHHSVLAIMQAAAGGLPMVTWTVRTPEELELARKHGAAPIFEGFSPALAMPARTPI